MNKGPSNSRDQSKSQRLEGWKEIATYVRRSVKTVQRLERKGLPIHRHDALGTVSAYTDELDAWLSTKPIDKQEDAEVQPEDTNPEIEVAAASESDPKWTRRRLALLVVGVALGVGLAFLLIGHKGNQADSPRIGHRSLAVLGFRNLTGRTEVAWLSTFLSEMLTAELAAGEKLDPVVR